MACMSMFRTVVYRHFIWQFQLGSANLKVRADSAELITKLFKHCIKSMKELKERIQHLETDNERLSQERINALKVRNGYGNSNFWSSRLLFTVISNY